MLRMSNGMTVEETRRSTPSGLLLASRDAFEAAIRFAEKCLNEVLEAQNQQGWRQALYKRIRAQQAIESVSRRVVAILEPAYWLGSNQTVPALDAVDAALLRWANCSSRAAWSTSCAMSSPSSGVLLVLLWRECSR